MNLFVSNLQLESKNLEIQKLIKKIRSPISFVENCYINKKKKKLRETVKHLFNIKSVNI